MRSIVLLLTSLLMMKGILGQEWGVQYIVTDQCQISIKSPDIFEEGKEVTVTCSVWKNSEYAPNWYDSNSYYLQGQIYSLSYSDSTLKFIPYRQNHGQVLQCRRYGCPAKELRLDVWYKPGDPQITMDPIDGRQVQEGAEVTLTCEAQSNPSAISYLWYRDEALIENIKTKTFHIPRASAASVGKYTCIAKNIVGVSSLSPLLTLNVLYRPDGVQLSSTAEVQNSLDEGQNVTLRCEVTRSNPPVTRYSWYKDGTELVTFPLAHLFIESITTSNSGIYHCAAHNKIGNSSSQPVSIRVACSSCGSTFPVLPLAVGAVALISVLLILGIGIFFYMRCKKRQKAAGSKSVGMNIYDNITSLPERKEDEGQISEYVYRNSQDLDTRESQEYFTHLSNHNSSTERGSEALTSGVKDPMAIYCQMQKPSRRSKTLALPGSQRQEVKAPEEVHYSTIQHFPQPTAKPSAPQEDSCSVYAKVKI